MSESNKKSKSKQESRKKVEIAYENEDENPDTSRRTGAKHKIEKESKDTEPKKSKGSKNFVPDNWEALMEGMRQMRKTHPAPVDTMGADACHDKTAPAKTQRFQKLVALLLSSQTKDEVTHAACIRLKDFGFTPENLSNADITDIEDVLKPVGFYKTKAKHLQRTSQILIDEYDSDIPDTVENLMKLPGIGPKMAHICMSTAWNVITGIGVDTHVHRISNRWKFVQKETKTPEEARLSLESWLPREHWDEITLLMVGFGQTICTPTKPKCEECVNNKICPSAFKESVAKKKK